MKTKTAIVYISCHGSTEKSARLLAKQLTDSDVDLINLKKVKHLNISDYDTIILGGSIHAGQIQQRLRAFMLKEQSKLMQKNIGLFVCCIETGDKAMEQFENVFPKKLRTKAIAKGIFGGEFNLDKLSWLERIVVRQLKGITESISNIDLPAIDRFAFEFNTLFKHI